MNSKILVSEKARLLAIERVPDSRFDRYLTFHEKTTGSTGEIFEQFTYCIPPELASAASRYGALIVKKEY